MHLIELEQSRARWNKFDPVIRISIEDEELIGPLLIQAVAALEPATPEAIITRLARLSSILDIDPRKDVNSIAVMFEDISEYFINEKYSYYAIDQGIYELVKKESSVWFPKVNKLCKYIEAVQYKMLSRVAIMQGFIMLNCLDREKCLTQQNK